MNMGHLIMCIQINDYLMIIYTMQLYTIYTYNIINIYNFVHHLLHKPLNMRIISHVSRALKRWTISCSCNVDAANQTRYRSCSPLIG